jgi:DNA recombination protein RmuC
MEYLYLLVGILIGGGIVFILKKNNSSLAGKLEFVEEAKLKLESENQDLREKVLNLNSELSTFMEKYKGAEDRLVDLNESKVKLSEQFENLANKIFQEKMTSFKAESKIDLEGVLAPFKEKIKEYQEVVTNFRNDEMKETSSLKTELDTILKLNQKLATEANNLTKALKGDKKSQGNWGELVLSRILESSGLREGEEYVLQAKDMGLSNSEGDVFRPDVILNLPEEKHLIIDSKVTLNGYDRYINAEEEVERNLALKEFLLALRNHIKQLSSKKYQNLDKILTPDFVLMFVPVEGAFSTALQLDSGLFEEAWEKRIILVSPTTLMVTLRTVESIWKQEKQNKYSQEIARQAGDLFDKFVGFTEDMSDIKKAIDNSQKAYDQALNKLTTGKGNVFKRFENLKDLGAKATKSLSLPFEE